MGAYGAYFDGPLGDLYREARIRSIDVEHANLVDLTTQGDDRAVAVCDLNFVAGLQTHEVVARLGKVDHCCEIRKAELVTAK